MTKISKHAKKNTAEKFSTFNRKRKRNIQPMDSRKEVPQNYFEVHNHANQKDFKSAHAYDFMHLPTAQLRADNVVLNQARRLDGRLTKNTIIARVREAKRVLVVIAAIAVLIVIAIDVFTIGSKAQSLRNPSSPFTG